MAAGVKTGGRQKGTPNKLGATAKENIACVFTRLGGVQQMVKWAEENPTQFYQIYAKLLPLQTELTGEDGGPINITQITLTALK
jgi:hypothetical protein